MKKVTLLLIAIMTLPIYSQHSATTIDQLLDRVEQGKINDNLENQQREREFRLKRDQQEKLLIDAETYQANEENRASSLESLFEANEAINNELLETLHPMLDIIELIDVFTRDTLTQFDNSLTNVQYPGRTIFLEGLAKKIDSNSKIPSIEEIERLWFELQREIKESGKVVKFTADVIDTNRSKVATEVVRVGLFNIVADGKYLNYDSSTDSLNTIPIQPEGRRYRGSRYTSSTSELFNPSNEKVAFGLDPTLGQVLMFIEEEEADCDLLCQLNQAAD